VRFITTEEEYIRMKSLLNTVIEQQALFAENQTKADARMARHEQAIAALRTLAEVHEQSGLRVISELMPSSKRSQQNLPRRTKGSMLSSML
jgi:hypothetical protein